MMRLTWICLVLMVTVGGCRSATVQQSARPAYATDGATLYSFTRERTQLVVRTWRHASQKFEVSRRVPEFRETPVAVISTRPGVFVLLSAGPAGVYSIVAIDRSDAVPPRVLWRGAVRDPMLINIRKHSEGLIVVGRQRIYYLDGAGVMTQLQSDVDEGRQEFSSVAVTGHGRIAINEGFSFVEYELLNGKLIERCRMSGDGITVRAIAAVSTKWVVLVETRSSGYAIMNVKSCEPTELAAELAPDGAWLLDSGEAQAVVHAPGRRQVFVAAESGVATREVPFVPAGLAYVSSDEARTTIFFVRDDNVLVYTLDE